MLFYSNSFIDCYNILLYGDISIEVDEALYEVELIIDIIFITINRFEVLL